MKVYTRIVVALSGDIVESESYEYEGRIVECKGGGGSSGHVRYPGYVERIHCVMLGGAYNADGTGTYVAPGKNLTQVMTAMLTPAIPITNPWTSQIAYDPDTELVTAISAVTSYYNLNSAFASASLTTLLGNIMPDSTAANTRLTNELSAYVADLDLQLMSNAYPRFEAGMRDINAVTTSAFTIGRSMIESEKLRDYARYQADLRMKLYTDFALAVIKTKFDIQKLLTDLTIESNRIKIVAKTEEMNRNQEIELNENTWHINVFQHAANLMAGIAGGTGVAGKPGGSLVGSAIGGGLAGAGMGLLLGGPVGAAVGGLLGVGSAFV